MTFREFMENVSPLVIYVDLDETLVRTTPIENASILIPYDRSGTFADRVPRIKKVVSDYNALSQEGKIGFLEKMGGKIVEGTDVTFARPHAVQFLNELHGMGRVVILTSGGTRFQSEVVRVLGLPVSEVYGRDQYRNLPKATIGFLIDDLGPETAGVTEKLRYAEIHEDNFIQIPRWRGEDGDNVLATFAEKVREAIKHGKPLVNSPYQF